MRLDKKMYKIVSIGEVLWDLLPTGKQLGGAPANVAYHVNALGENGIVISCLGKDPLGKEIRDQYNSLNIEQTYLYNHNSLPTGTVTVDFSADNQPIYTINENVAWDYIPWSDKLNLLAKETAAVVFGTLASRNTYSKETIFHFLDAAKDCLLVFDINLRQDYYTIELIEEMLKKCHILKINDDELAILQNKMAIKGTESDCLKTIMAQFNIDIIALTKGDKGSILQTKTQSSYVPSIPTTVIDTVGAGDAFTAGLVVGVLRNIPLSKLHRDINDLASFVCSQRGATPAINYPTTGSID